MRPIESELLFNRDLYRTVVLDKLAHARESVWIATANVKDMQVEVSGRFRSVVELFDDLHRRGVELRVLHAELPSRPFRRSFERKGDLIRSGLELKICPRVHFKAVLVDGAWLYLGSANLTGAGLGAKADGRRNFEVGLCTEDFDAIDRVSALFQAVWTGAECASCKLRAICPDPIGPEPPRGLRRSRRLRRG